MVTEEGVVQEIVNRNALVRIQKGSGCAHCASRGACEAVTDREMVVEVGNDLQAGAGDRVEISVLERSLLKLSLLVYLLPVVVFIAGAMAGGKWGQAMHVDSTLASIFVGGAAMGAAFMVLKRFDRSVRAGSELRPRMTRILFRVHSGQDVEEVKNQSTRRVL